MYYLSNVYLLDLCILSYHLHAQTLIFPFDPYYEFSKDDAKRDALMEALRFAYKGDFSLHGPGSCQGTKAEGWDSNDGLEPIFSDYKRIHPWRPSFTRPDAKNEPWIVYDTPIEITRRIGAVTMVRYSPKAGPYSKLPKQPVVEVDSIQTGNPSATTPQPDLLYCFEGGTGAVYPDPTQTQTQQQYAAWSMMGFVLAHELEDQASSSSSSSSSSSYDVFIVFRGSRSGELRPAQAGWKEMGNPDWVTDLQIKKKPVTVPEISETGKCVQGFSASLKTMLATVMRCLQEVHKTKQKPPRLIYVTGHSLGAALASLFTSAILLGNSYGPDGDGLSMPQELKKSWPWQAIRLVAFSSPGVGDEEFRAALDAKCPGTGIWVKGDPIPMTELLGRRLVGITRELDKKDQILKNTEAKDGAVHPHDPLAVRRLLLSDLGQKAKGIPMTGDNEPWKFFQSTDTMLGTLEQRRKPNELAALIPNCEDFLLLLLQNLQNSYTAEANADITLILTEIRRLNQATQNTFEKVRSLCLTLQTRNALYKKKFLYDLIGLCLFFNALSKDTAVYADHDKFNVLKPLIGLKTVRKPHE
jgi:hypothetical protein